MNIQYKNNAKIMMFLLIAMILAGSTSSCKSKKKIAREKAATEYAAKVSQSKQDLVAMLAGTTNWTLDEQEQRLDAIKSFNIADEEVVELIPKVEAKLSMDRAEEARKAEEEKLRKEEEKRLLIEKTKYQPIDNKFENIANTQNTASANNAIAGMLSEFATPDVPVIIIISNAGGFNDYDRPTTINKFLNYLKDKQSYNYRISSLKRNKIGKITELELIKKSR